MRLVLKADAAEARGDAWGALEVINDDLVRHGDPRFWRPSRILRLTQLESFGSIMPGWVVSRWVVEQAAQHMGGAAQRRVHEALDLAIEARGGVERLPGFDHVGDRTWIMDHDWVYRQVLVYQLGALDHFVRTVASPELLARADGVRTWAHAPMGGFRLVDVAPATITWFDLGSGVELTMANHGAAACRRPGDAVIGRVVATEGGLVFETPPLSVPEEVARRVADEPTAWVDTLTAARRRTGFAADRIPSDIWDFPLMTDVSQWAADQLVESVLGPIELAEPASAAAEQLLDSRLRLVRTAMHGDLPPSAGMPNPLPVVGAVVLDPAVFLELATGLGPDDGPALERMAAQLAGPPAAVCAALAVMASRVRQPSEKA